MVKISIQGSRGSYHDIVARQRFPGDSEIIECPTNKKVFEDVKKGVSDYGVIAIENSSYGSFLNNYDLMTKYDTRISGEAYLHIVFNLIGFPGAAFKDISEVYSHPQALADCHDYLEQHPGLKRIETDDTAGSLLMLKERDLRQAAAIASRLSAEIHGMHILARDIGSNKKNYTRFLFISREADTHAAAGKTSLVIRAKNIPGSLYQCLKCFADEKINLTKLESRPVIGDSWQYFFYLDFERGLHTFETQRALKELDRVAGMVKVLGSYESGAMLES